MIRFMNFPFCLADHFIRISQERQEFKFKYRNVVFFPQPIDMNKYYCAYDVDTGLMMVQPISTFKLESIKVKFFKVNQRAKTYNASHIHEIVLKKPSKYCCTRKLFLGAVLMICIDPGDDYAYSYLLYDRHSGKFLGTINLPKDDRCDEYLLLCRKR